MSYVITHQIDNTYVVYEAGRPSTAQIFATFKEAMNFIEQGFLNKIQGAKPR